MSVAASTLFSRVRSMLDDDNSDRYTVADDLIPALNSAISYITSVFSAAFEQNKVQPEVLSELSAVMIMDPEVTGNTAKINLNSHTNLTPFRDKVWTIIGIDPNPTYTATPILSESLLRFAKRLTLEEWNHALGDPFAPGTGITVPSDFQRVCYMGPGRYFWDGDTMNEDPYLLLRPGSLFSAATARVGIWVLTYHDVITADTDVIYFPVTVHSLLEQKMLNYLSYQHDNPKYYQVSDKEVKELITLMNM